MATKKMKHCAYCGDEIGMTESSGQVNDMNEQSPFDKGYADYARNVAPPPFPTPDSPWSARLYNRGWEAARRDDNGKRNGRKQ